jgi:hypothetical protein
MTKLCTFLPGDLMTIPFLASLCRRGQTSPLRWHLAILFLPSFPRLFIHPDRLRGILTSSPMCLCPVSCVVPCCTLKFLHHYMGQSPLRFSCLYGM